MAAGCAAAPPSLPEGSSRCPLAGFGPWRLRQPAGRRSELGRGCCGELASPRPGQHRWHCASRTARPRSDAGPPSSAKKELRPDQPGACWVLCVHTDATVQFRVLHVINHEHHAVVELAVRRLLPGAMRSHTICRQRSSPGGGDMCTYCGGRRRSFRGLARDVTCTFES